MSVAVQVGANTGLEGVYYLNLGGVVWPEQLALSPQSATVVAMIATMMAHAAHGRCRCRCWRVASLAQSALPTSGPLLPRVLVSAFRPPAKRGRNCVGSLRFCTFVNLQSTTLVLTPGPDKVSLPRERNDQSNEHRTKRSKPPYTQY